jgi:hypothetical protein
MLQGASTSYAVDPCSLLRSALTWSLHVGEALHLVCRRYQDTTGVAEGWHSLAKGWVRCQGSENLRLDRLLHVLLQWIGGLYAFKDVCRFHSTVKSKRSNT